MELHQLDYVLAVAHHQNFSRAAEDIKVSQPSLSQQITKLERELGTSLFVRTTRYVQLTAAGKEFITHARRILLQVNEARDCIQEYLSIKKGRLKLGTLSVVGYYNLPNLVTSFHKKFPGINLDILEGQCEELLYALQTSKIDAAFVQVTKPNHNFHVNTLVTDKMVLVVNYPHPLSHRMSVDLKELRNEKFIITPATSGHYQDFHNACLAAGFTPNIAINCGVVNTMLSFVREGLGVTVLSSKVAAEECDPSIRIVPITPFIHREIALVTLRNTDLPPTLKVFLKFSSQWLKTQAEPKTTMMQQNQSEQMVV